MSALSESVWLKPQPAQLFKRRAARLRQLAQTPTAMSAYLTWLAQLCDAQQCVHAQGLHRWQTALTALLAEFTEQSGVVGRCAVHLKQQPHRWAEWLDATRNQQSADSPDDAAAQIWLAAAWQVQRVVEVAQAPADEARTASDLCPACQSPAVMGVLQGGSGARYLVCPWCALQWRRERLHCTHCGDNRDLSYFSLADDAVTAVQAEACGHCHTYLKLIDLEKTSEADALADDLASLGLDVLLAEAGYARASRNPLLG